MEPGDVGGATRFEHRFVVTHVEGCAVNRSFGLPSRLWLGEAVRLLPKRPAVAQRQAERAKAMPRSLARRPRPTPLCRSLPGGFYGGIFVGPDRILSLGGRLVRLHPKNRLVLPFGGRSRTKNAFLFCLFAQSLVIKSDRKLCRYRTSFLRGPASDQKPTRSLGPEIHNRSVKYRAFFMPFFASRRVPFFSRS